MVERHKYIHRYRYRYRYVFKAPGHNIYWSRTYIFSTKHTILKTSGFASNKDWKLGHFTKVVPEKSCCKDKYINGQCTLGNEGKQDFLLFINWFILSLQCKAI